MKKILLIVYGFLASTALAFGQSRSGGETGNCTNPNDPNCLPNPLTYTSFTDLLDGIAKFLLLLAVPVATIIIIYGAFLILTSAGSADKVEQGKKAILYAAIGLGIMLLFRVIMALIASLLGANVKV